MVKAVIFNLGCRLESSKQLKDMLNFPQPLEIGLIVLGQGPGILKFSKRFTHPRAHTHLGREWNLKWFAAEGVGCHKLKVLNIFSFKNQGLKKQIVEFIQGLCSSPTMGNERVK